MDWYVPNLDCQFLVSGYMDWLMEGIEIGLAFPQASPLTVCVCAVGLII